jgi:hypothetical protein
MALLQPPYDPCGEKQPSNSADSGVEIPGVCADNPNGIAREQQRADRYRRQPMQRNRYPAIPAVAILAGKAAHAHPLAQAR